MYSNLTKSVEHRILYQYLKNHVDFKNLKFEDYYEERRIASIMLITGQIHHEMIKAQQKLQYNTSTTNE